MGLPAEATPTADGGDAFVNSELPGVDWGRGRERAIENQQEITITVLFLLGGRVDKGRGDELLFKLLFQ
jgi:hypothetical protein